MSELQVLLDNSQRRNKELSRQLKDAMAEFKRVSRENVDLEAQATAMQIMLIEIERTIDESLSGIKKHTVTFWLDLMGKIVKATDEFKAGRKLLDRLKKLEAVVEKAEIIAAAGVNGGLKTNGKTTLQAYMDLSRVLANLKGGGD